jgi:hypothetical protein
MRNVDLSVFDVRGHKVVQLLHGDMPAGDHRVAFSASGLSTGTYFARLTTEHGITTKRVIIEH